MSLSRRGAQRSVPCGVLRPGPWGANLIRQLWKYLIRRTADGGTQPSTSVDGDDALVLDLAQLSIDQVAAVGGKAANLGELIRAGFDVPPGFCVTTEAYRRAVRGTTVEAGTSTDAPAARAAVLDAPFPESVADAVRDAYARLESGGEGPVAVRSSATAEDLPGASFAGQQDTYLNVAGIDDVLDAVHRCWASLWTDRAVAYRAAQGIDGSGVALAVVVQRMVDAESAGVLFTADPVTGRRHQAVLDAARGLGDAVVSGAVDPDHFVVDTGNRADPRPAPRRLGRQRGGQPDGRAGASAGVAGRPSGARIRSPAGHRMGRGRRRTRVADAVPADHDAVSGPGARRAAARRRHPRLLLHQPRAGPPPPDHADGHRRLPRDRLGVPGLHRPSTRADHRRAGRFRGRRRPDLRGRDADRAIGGGPRDLSPRPGRDGGTVGRRAPGAVRRPAVLGAAGVPATFRAARASPRRAGSVAVRRRAGARQPGGRAAPRAAARGRGPRQRHPGGRRHPDPGRRRRRPALPHDAARTAQPARCGRRLRHARARRARARAAPCSPAICRPCSAARPTT